MFKAKNLVFNLIIITCLSAFSLNTFAYEYLNLYPSSSYSTPEQILSIKNAIAVINKERPLYFQYVFNPTVQINPFTITNGVVTHKQDKQVSIYYADFSDLLKRGILPYSTQTERYGYQDPDCVGGTYKGDVFINSKNVKDSNYAKYVLIHELTHIAGVACDENTNSNNYMYVNITGKANYFTSNSQRLLALGRVQSPLMGLEATPLYKSNHAFKSRR